MTDIFISYDRGSQALVETLADDIKGLGHTVWFDQELSGGQSWWDQILEKVRNCDVFVFALAPRALESVACTREYEYAYALGKPIIPVLITNGVPTSLLPEALSQIHYVDFRNPSEKAAALKVGRALTAVSLTNSLPDPLPTPPEVPLSYMGGLAKRMGAPDLSYEEQAALIVDVKGSLRDPATAYDAIALLKRLRQRQDLFAKVETEINELLEVDREQANLNSEQQEKNKTPSEAPKKSLFKPIVAVALILVLGVGSVMAFQYQQDRTAERERQVALQLEADNAAEVERQRLIDEAAETERQRIADAAAEEERQRLIDEAAEAQKQRFLAIGAPEMVRIPTGSFQMGSNNGDSREKPVHRVNIIQPFALSRHEVTFAQYDVYAEATGASKPEDQGWGRGNRPVINVSWNDIQSYIAWLNGQTGGGYRLPSEAEWEYAARAGTTTEYSWGNEIGVNQANCDGCGSEWDDRQTAPVGSFSENDFGLFDMHGNVIEWVQDCWADNYDNAPVDGSAYEGGSCGLRVLRGGSWHSNPRGLRSADRDFDGPTSRIDGSGFRLAQDL